MNEEKMNEEKINETFGTLEDAIAEMLLKGVQLKDIKGLDEQSMAVIHKLGLNFYKAGQMAEAETVFKFLVLFDNANQEYWIGMGAVLQVQKQFEKALVAYEYAVFLDIENPQPFYHAAECYVALGRIEDAESALDALKEEFKPENAKNSKYLMKGEKLRELIEQLKASK